MKINPELVTRFLNNECSREEAEWITNYFEANPAELEHYIGEAEWKQFAGPQTLPETTSHQVWKQIKEEAAIRPRIQRSWYTYAAAAAIFTLIAGSILWFITQPDKQTTAARPASADSLQLATIINNTTHNKQFTLEDGSEITLTPNSTLEYPSPFGKKQRYLKLEGKALFKVAQEHDRPFTVAAGGLTTTALGTSFWIESRRSKTHLHIKLVTGKVVIQKDTTGNTIAFQPVYLAPGQELQFDKQKQLAMVSAISDNQHITQPIPANKANAGNAANTLVFNQQSLPVVLQTLQQHYHISIQFSAAELRKMKFSGNYTDADNIDDILNTVALINDLKLEKTTSGYSITK